jgi:hypothetical protein
MHARIKAAIIGIAALGMVGIAAPAFAGTPPTGSNLPTTVTVQTPTISLVMTTTSLSITGQPGSTAQSAADAVAYSVTSQSPYEVTIAAPDLVSGGNTLPADALSDMWSVAPGTAGASTSGTTTLAEGDSPVVTYNSGSKTSGNGNGTADTFAEQWQAVLPGTLPAGNYATTVSYVAMATAG